MSQNSNENPASTQLSNTYIMSNNILRNVYQIGFNSRNITKTLTNNLEIKEISNDIIKDTKNNIISVRSYGPLLLGLVLIYKKKIILFIEDVFNTLKNKFNNNNNNENFDDDDYKKNIKKETQSAIKLKLNSENFNIMSLTPIKNEKNNLNIINENDDLSDNKYFNNIFTPNKNKSTKDLLTMDSNEMLRRSINNSLLNDKINTISIKNNNNNNNNNDGSINNLSSLLQKVKKPLTENKINKKNSLLNNNLNFNDSFNENNKEDDFNFFNFISQKNEFNNNNNNEFNNNNNDFDFTDSNIFDNNFFKNEKSSIKKYNFKEIESIFSNKEKKEKPFVFKNKNLEFDEEISIPIKIDDFTKENNFNIDEITNKFKNNLIIQNKTLDTSNLENFNNQSKYEYLAPNFIIVESENENEIKRNDLSFSNVNVSSNLISERKKISIESFSNVGKDLIYDLSKLNLDKDDFDGILFNEKIEEIEKENNENINNNNNENFFSGFSQNYQIHADDNFGFCDSFNDYKNFMENELNKQNEKLNEEIKKFKEIIEMIYDKLIEIGNNRKKYFLEGYKKIFNKEFQNEDQFKLDFPKIDLNENNNGINFEELNNNINQTFINYNEFTRVVDNWMIYKEETFNINSHNQNSNNNSICENNNNNNIDNDVFMSLIECVEFYRKLNEKYLDLNNRLILSCYLNVMKENEIKKIELKIINNENNNYNLNDLFKHFVNDVNLYEKKKEKTWKETIENYKNKLINENKNNVDINNNNNEIKKWNLNVEEIENDYKKYENLSNEIIELIKDLELMKKNNIEKNEKNLKEFKNILEIVNEKEENNKMEIDKN
jgi:hypothetical protein